MTKQIEAFEAWWADTGEQSLYALNTTTDDDIKILAGIAWEAAIREALAEPVTISCNCGDMYERNSFGGKFIQQYGCCPNCDAAEPVQEPVAVISESAIGLVKLHSNGVCLPFGTQLYTAPVSAEAIRAEALEEAAKWFEDEEHPLQPKKVAAAIRGLK